MSDAQTNKPTREQMIAKLNSLPQDVLKELVNKNAKAKIATATVENTITPIKNLNDLFSIEFVLISAIAARENIGLQQMLYDLNNSYYKQLNDGKVNIDNFKFPSDNLDTNELFLNKDKDTTIKDIEISESETQKIETFKNSILQNLDVGIKSDKPNDFIESLKKLKSKKK